MIPLRLDVLTGVRVRYSHTQQESPVEIEDFVVRFNNFAFWHNLMLEDYDGKLGLPI